MLPLLVLSSLVLGNFQVLGEYRREFDCDFNDKKVNYRANDLLQCMNRISRDYLYPGDEESALNTDGFSVTDFLANIFKVDPESLHQFPSALPANPVSSYYQSNYPAAPGGSLDSSGDTGSDLFGALYAISRYDELKCVPRILCEVASGSKPGQSNYGVTANPSGDLGTYSFLGLLNMVDISRSTPILNFAKAALLGYTSKGNSENCYREYSRCPRDPNRLVHYLNNHNGGFFRFFNGLGAKRRITNYVQPTRYTPYVVNKIQPQAPLPREESDRTGTGELKFDTTEPTARRDYGANFFPGESSAGDVNRVAFHHPQQEESEDRPWSTRASKSLFNLDDPDIGQQEDSPIFVQETRRNQRNMLSSKDRIFARLPRTQMRFPSDDLEDTDSNFYSSENLHSGTGTNLVFPQDEDSFLTEI